MKRAKRRRCRKEKSGMKKKWEDKQPDLLRSPSLHTTMVNKDDSKDEEEDDHLAEEERRSLVGVPMTIISIRAQFPSLASYTTIDCQV